MEVYDDGEHDSKVEEVKSSFQDHVKFWTLNKNRFPSLSRLAAYVLALCPSGAEKERSFKLLRCILPKDHTRDSLGPDMIKHEMFFAYNRDSLQLFNLNSE